MKENFDVIGDRTKRYHHDGDVIYQVAFYPTPEYGALVGPSFDNVDVLKKYLRTLATDFRDDPDLEVYYIHKEVMDGNGRFQSVSFDDTQMLYEYRKLMGWD